MVHNSFLLFFTANALKVMAQVNIDTATQVCELVAPATDQISCATVWTKDFTRGKQVYSLLFFYKVNFLLSP